MWCCCCLFVCLFVFVYEAETSGSGKYQFGETISSQIKDIRAFVLKNIEVSYCCQVLFEKVMVVVCCLLCDVCDICVSQPRESMTMNRYNSNNNNINNSNNNNSELSTPSSSEREREREVEVEKQVLLLSRQRSGVLSAVCSPGGRLRDSLTSFSYLLYHDTFHHFTAVSVLLCMLYLCVGCC